MSPIPEPMHGARQQPGGTEEDEELTTPSGMPPGNLPPSSSDEELDPSDPENAPSGYHPLPQDLEADDNDWDEIDYTSLSGLMSALATRGPNIITVNENEEALPTAAEGMEGRGRDDVLSLVEESSQEWEATAVRERAAVWNLSPPPAPDRLHLDCGKVEQIKSVMASFTLPESAIPPWAQNLSEEEWKSKVSDLLVRRKCQ